MMVGVSNQVTEIDHVGNELAAPTRAHPRDGAACINAGMPGVRIAPIRITPLLTSCEEHGEDPANARARYAAGLARLHPEEPLAGPPGRNAPCWRGSGCKDEECCAAPGAR